MGNIGDRAISGLITLVLAGFLGPREFGIVSISLIYVNFMQMFLDQGLAPALIQKKELQQEHCDAVFWVNLITSLTFVGLTVLISGWWAKINHAPDLARVLSVLSLCIPIEGLSIVQAAMVRREMDFKTLTIRSNVSGLLGGVAGLVMALCGLGVWALVGLQLTRDFSGLLLLWRLGHWRPRFEFSWPHFADLLGFKRSCCRSRASRRGRSGSGVGRRSQGACRVAAVADEDEAAEGGIKQIVVRDHAHDKVGVSS